MPDHDGASPAPPSADDPVCHLLARLSDGHQSPAWAEFVRLYTPLLRHWLKRRLQPADVDDVVQDVLVVVLDKLPGFIPSGPGTLRAWLRAILGYRLHTHWRQRLRHPAAGGTRDPTAALAERASSLARGWDDAHDRHVIHRLLAEARTDFRPATFEAFYRATVLEEPPEAVANDMGVTTNAVFIARSRVLRRLRQVASRLAPAAHTLSPSASTDVPPSPSHVGGGIGSK